MNELAQAQVAPPQAAPVAPQTAGQELAPDQQAQAPQLPQPLDAVAAGQQPATVLPPVQPNQPPDDVQEFVISNFDKLQTLGLEAFEAPDMSTIVFNPQLVGKADIENAVKTGTLDQLLSPAPQQGQELAGAAPQAAPKAAPAGPDTTAIDVAQQHSGQRASTNVEAPKAPASTQNMLAKARVRNMGAGAKPAGLVPNPVGNQLSKRAL